jgi:hypothetical protein
MINCKYLSQRTVLHFIQIFPDLRYLNLDTCFSTDVDTERLVDEMHKYNENVNI